MSFTNSCEPHKFLAHLAKCLVYADIHGRPTIGLLYGHTAAWAFLATAMVTRVLVGQPSASLVVMDRSIAKVTKLSIEVLKVSYTNRTRPDRAAWAVFAALRQGWLPDGRDACFPPLGVILSDSVSAPKRSRGGE